MELEVPWREARATRSARREDLVRLLTPVARLPESEVLRASLQISERPLSDDNYPEPPRPGPRTGHLSKDLHFVPRSAEPIVIPFHRCNVSAAIGGGQEIHFNKIRLVPPTVHSFHSGGFASRPDSVTVEGTSSELIVGGPGSAKLLGEVEPETRPLGSDSPARILITLAVAGAELPLTIDFLISPHQPFR